MLAGPQFEGWKCRDTVTRAELQRRDTCDKGMHGRMMIVWIDGCQTTETSVTTQIAHRQFLLFVVRKADFMTAKRHTQSTLQNLPQRKWILDDRKHVNTPFCSSWPAYEKLAKGIVTRDLVFFGFQKFQISLSKLGVIHGLVRECRSRRRSSLFSYFFGVNSSASSPRSLAWSPCVLCRYS
jgi:hypothetical protein